MDELISIIVPVYNIEDYIKDCLNSLANQTYKSVEIIVINDGSTDGSLAVCEEFQRKYSNIIVFSQENAGLSEARNTGLRLAKGKYISFVDGDDYIDIRFCETAIHFMKVLDLSIFISGIIFDECNNVYWKGDIDSDIELLKKYADRVLSVDELLAGYCEWVIPSCAWGKVYRKDIFDEHGFLFPPNVFFEDALLTLKYIASSKRGYFSCDPRVSYYYVQRLNSITQDSIYLRGPKLRDRFNSYIQCYYEMKKYVNEELISKKYTNIYVRIILNRFAGQYAEYQKSIFMNLIISDISEAIKDDITCCLFGAGAYGESYVRNLNICNDNIFFVDNKSCLHNTKINKLSIYSPDVLKQRKPTYILISSTFLFEIIEQLADMGLIQSFADIMPYKGSTQLEKLYLSLYNDLRMIWEEYY